MAYGTRYTATWVNGTKTGTLYIEQKDYVGASESLSLVNDALTITKKFDNWQTHIAGDMCEFNIRNDKADYFTLMDLMKAKERKYRIRVDAVYNSKTYILFAGFINTEAVVQKYTKYAVIHLVASNFISKLEYVYPDSLDTIGNMTFIDVITEIMQQTGNTYNIRVCSFLLSDANIAATTGKTFMNQNGISSEIFWVNNVERKSSKVILEEILKSFECYMHFWDGYWYIESFDVLHFAERTYVEYAYNQTYSPLQAGTEQDIEYVSKDIHSLQFLETMQSISTVPGNRNVTINVEVEPYYNLTVSDFKGVVKIGSGQMTNVDFRQWSAYEPMTQSLMEWDGQGLPYKSMQNSIKRTSTWVNSPNADNFNSYPYRYNGLSTKFRITNEGNVGEAGTTSINFQWLFTVGNQIGTSIVCEFRYRIDILDANGVYIGTVWHNRETDTWQLATSINYTDYITRKGVDFDSKYVTTVNAELDFAILKNYSNPGDVFYSGDYIVVFGLFTEQFYIDGKPQHNSVEPLAYYGDVLISASLQELETNQIEGKTNTDFLEKLEINISIADAPNWNYKTGILQGDSLENLTKSWRRNEPLGTERKIEDYILIDKFRTGDVVRETLSAKVRSAALLKLFEMYHEPKQADMKFLITEMVHDVTHDIYDLKLREYDNTTVINLVEEA